METTVNRSNTSSAGVHLERVNVVYRWRRVSDPNTSFVVVLRSVESPLAQAQRQLQEISKSVVLRVHRLFSANSSPVPLRSQQSNFELDNSIRLY